MADQTIQVLLVEDGPTDALIVREELTPGLGIHFNVTHVERLAEAFTRLKEQAFEVVLLDLSLPDSDGFETFTRLREEAADVPIIVLSGGPTRILRSRPVQSGAQGLPDQRSHGGPGSLARDPVCDRTKARRSGPCVNKLLFSRKKISR